MNVIKRLDELLEKINPANTIIRYERRRDTALNTFDYRTTHFETFKDFEKYFKDFYCHVIYHLFGCNLPYVNVQEVFGRYEYGDFVWKEFPPHGDSTAWRFVRANVEGGLYGVLKKMATRLTDEAILNSIEVPLFDFLKDLTFDEKQEIAREYSRRYRNLIPPDWTKNDCVMIAAFLEQVLKDYPFMLVRMRRINP